MENMLQEILEIDRQAQQLIDEAKEKKDHLEQDIAREEAQIRATAQQQAVDELNRAAPEIHGKAKQEEDTVRRAYAALRSQMETRFDDNRAIWVDTIVKRILEGEA